jgi:signal transduction histidine kinase
MHLSHGSLLKLAIGLLLFTLNGRALASEAVALPDAEEFCARWSANEASLDAQWQDGKPLVLEDLINAFLNYEAQLGEPEAFEFLESIALCTDSFELKLWLKQFELYRQGMPFNSEVFAQVTRGFLELESCSKYYRIHQLYFTTAFQQLQRTDLQLEQTILELEEEARRERCDDGLYLMNNIEVLRLCKVQRFEEASRLSEKLNIPGDSPYLKWAEAQIQIHVNLGTKRFVDASKGYEGLRNYWLQRRDTTRVIASLNNMAFTFREAGKIDSAMFYFEKAEALAEAVNHLVWLGIIRGNIASCNFILEDYTAAIDGLLQDYEFTRFTNDHRSGISSLIMAAEAYQRLEKLDSANYWLNIAERELNQWHKGPKGSEDLRERMHFRRYAIAKERGNTQAALIHLEAYQSLSDSLTQDQLQRQSRDQQVLMTAERLYADKRALLAKDEANRELISKQRIFVTVTLIFTGVLVLALFAVYALFKQQRQDRKQTAELLDTSQQQNNRLKNFALIVSHNLRGSAGNIKSLVELLQADKTSNDQEEILEHLGMASDSLNQTINDLNGLIKNYSSSKEELVSVELYPVVRQVTRNMQEAEGRQDFEVEITIPQGLHVRGIPSYIESVVYNFTSNAYKYRHADRYPRLRIVAEEKEDGVFITFEDNGQGIDLEKHKADLFKLFSTFHENEDAQGVGLYATHNQVRSMGGTIDVCSTPGEGTTFTVKLQPVQPN